MPAPVPRPMSTTFSPLPADDAAILGADSAFSYQCKACGRCCHHKRIQVGPYEILRLARNRRLSTTELARQYIEDDGPWLRVNADGSCIFLEAGRCSVHADRPLACRVYPLGRWVDAEGRESYRRVRPHPQSEGIYGAAGVLREYLDRQGALPYMAAGDRYQALFYRLLDALQKALPARPGLAAATCGAMTARHAANGLPDFMEWLDVDAVVAHYCREHGLPLPESIDAAMALHIAAVDHWLHSLEGQAP